MSPISSKGPGHFQCGCGARISVEGLPAESDKRCPVRFKRGRCLRPKKSFEPVCERCAVGTAQAVLRSPRLRDQIADQQAVEQLNAARSLAWEREKERRTTAWQRLKTYGAHVVYYVVVRPGVVKIGTTSSLTGRLQGLRLRPEDVLAAEPGDRRVEKQRHEQFDHLRIQKRWEDFTLTDDLQAHIDAVAAEHGDPFALEGWLTDTMRQAEAEDRRRRGEEVQLA